MYKETFFFYGSIMRHPPEPRFVTGTLAGTVSGVLCLFNTFFPAAILHTSGDAKIKGLIVHYEFPEDEGHRLRWMFEDMDRFEGFSQEHLHLSHYLRKLVKVQGEDGEDYLCQMYVINKDNPHPMIDLNTMIPDGDWEKWRVKKYGS